MPVVAAPPSLSRRAYRGSLAIIVVMAAVVRIYGLSDLPPGLFCDEAALGYNAYSILETGRDENGELFPLFVWSFQVSYKNPVFIYASIGPIAAFGLSEFSVRLTAALFGVLGVLAIGLLGRLLLGTVGGLIAALLLALVPWHVHFSRIAFELISFPTLFMLGFVALVVGLRGRSWFLLAAGALWGWSLYSYGPAKLFVPLFLLGVLIVHARRLFALGRWTVAAFLVLCVTAAPVVLFDLGHYDRPSRYFQATTTLNTEQPLRQNVQRVVDQYTRFYSRAFLFDEGDPLRRHSVGGFGELYRVFLPLLVAGVLWSLWPGNPHGKLLLWWLAIFPIAPALMNEAPSASRGVIGVGVFCLLAAAGATVILRLLASIVPLSSRKVRFAIQGAAVAALLIVVGREAWSYGRAYVERYPAASADAFQYGYRETLRVMEERRDDYDLLLLTANDVNQPQIFTAFYNQVDPRLRRQESGYLIIDPAEFDRYEMGQRILAALREEDLRLFEEYTTLHTVHSPGGGVEYVIAELHERRRFIRDWAFIGPLADRGDANDGATRAAQLSPPDQPGLLGRVAWERRRPLFVWADFNDLYERRMRGAGRSTVGSCAYAVTQIESAAEQGAFLEVSASHQMARFWVDGRPLLPRPEILSKNPRRWPIRLAVGDTELLVQLCKRSPGAWSFTARVTDGQGRDLTDLRFRADVLGSATGDGGA